MFFLSFSVLAQNGEGAKQIQAQKVAFMTQRMGLTPEEAQQFWPLYNQYAENLKLIRQNFRAIKSEEDATDDQIEKTILANFEKEQKEIDLKKEYFQKLKKVINIRKIQKMYHSENDFRKEVLQEIRRKKDK